MIRNSGSTESFDSPFTCGKSTESSIPGNSLNLSTGSLIPENPSGSSINRFIDRFHQKQQTHERKKDDKTNVSKKNTNEMVITDSFVEEPIKQIPILAKCKVLVIGGGPSGICAAIAASRALNKSKIYHKQSSLNNSENYHTLKKDSKDPDVIIMERYGCLGGCITTVGMETLSWFRYEGCVDSSGIGIEMERLAETMGASTKWPYNDSPCLDADYFKIVADELIREASVKPILHCYAVETIIKDSKIRGCICESKSGRQAVLATVVIDCTGDADVAHLSGSLIRKTEKESMMGVTSVFSVSGLNVPEFKRHVEKNPKTYKDWSRTWDQETTGKENHLETPYFDAEFEEAEKLGIIESAKNLGGSWSAISKEGEATNLNLVHLKNVDGTNVLDLTEAEIKGRKEALNALIALKKMVPGFQDAKLRNFGMTLGIRDTRKIIGKYSLTGLDVMSEARFYDSIGIFPEFLDGYNVLVLPTTGRYFQVPLGCCIPKEGPGNLLVAGRCVAGDKLSHTAMRNMMACCVTGQGAGVAAAVAVLLDKTVLEVSKDHINEIQKELCNQGVRIE
jgi:hypothetical protein